MSDGLPKIDQSFPKSEHLTSKILIKELFEEGSFFFNYPFKILYLFKSGDGGFRKKILISVPRKSYKKAVDRNLLKRRVREAYRKNKHKLDLNVDGTLYIAYIYTGNVIESYQRIEGKLISTLERLHSSISKIDLQ